MEVKIVMQQLADKLIKVSGEIDTFRKQYLLAKAEYERKESIFKKKLQVIDTKIPQHRIETEVGADDTLYMDKRHLIVLSCSFEDAKNRFEVITQQLNAKKAEYKIEGSIL